MRLGLFGGTFDPLHNGHLIAASDALTALALDRVVFIPAAVQPLKVASPATAPAHRLAMVRAAIGGDVRFAIDALEIDRSGLSFTVDTLETYAARHPTDDLFLLVGADVLATFDQWRLPDRIRALATLAVLERSGSETAMSGTGGERGEQVAPAAGSGTDGDVRMLRTRRVDISSTEIRARVRDGLPIRGFVPESVASYIGEHGLYR